MLIYTERFLEKKMSFGLEFSFEKISSYHNNPEKSSTTKTYMHKPSCYLLFTQCLFDSTKK